MPGYVRQDTTNNIEAGNIIDAQDLDNEFNALQTAFSLGSGHRHNGAAGEGAPITVIGPNQEVEANASALRPNTTNVIDLGTTSLRFKAGFFQGTITAGAFAGSGAALTSLNASQLTSGNVDAARVVGSYPNITGVGVLTVGSIGSGFGNINIGAGIFTGNGSGLTNLNATNIVTGTLSSDRLPTIPLTKLPTIPSSQLATTDAEDGWVVDRFIGRSNDGERGQMALLKNISGSTIGTGSTAFSIDLRYSSTAGNESSAPSGGTWKCLSNTPNGAVGLFIRI